jgi:hypothetical protein
MSKIDELESKKINNDLEFTEAGKIFHETSSEINAEIEKLEKEFEQKVKRLFRGIHINIKANKEGLEVCLGEASTEEHFMFGSNPHILGYNSSSYGFKKVYIARATADKIKALYIEYFGEL